MGIDDQPEPLGPQRPWFWQPEPQTRPTEPPPEHPPTAHPPAAQPPAAHPPTAQPPAAQPPTAHPPAAHPPAAQPPAAQPSHPPAGQPPLPFGPPPQQPPFGPPRPLQPFVGALPYAPPPPPKRRKGLLVGVLGVVLALVAGLTTWLLWPARPQNREPFDAALAALSTARGIKYTGAQDVTTTAYGDQFGTAGSDDLLRVGGKLYTKAESGKWQTGNPADQARHGELIDRLPPPYLLAARLSEALDQLPELPADAPPLTIGGVPALKAPTSAGTLYVAREKPYRVLRLEPAKIPSGAGGAQASPQDPEGVDLSPLADTEAERMFDTLAERTGQLAEAVDAGVNFALTADGALNCSAAGCQVTENFTGTLTTDARTRITGGQVTATMTATVTIDGRSAGGCVSAPATLPLTGTSVSGSLSCHAAQAGPVFAAVEAEYRARAQAQAGSTGGTVTLRFFSRAQARIEALALAQAEVQVLLDQQKQERAITPCPTPNSFTAGTPVLLADGTTRPIEQVTPGTQVLATDPTTGETAAAPVLARITGTGRKQLDRLTVSDGTRAGTVTATAEHPFWTARGWVDAADIVAGDTLSGLATVTATAAEERDTEVYNLTVDRLHTYHVLAGDIPVLVHNDGDSPVGTIVNEDGVRIQIYSNDHGPPHAHVKGGGKEVRIGQNGKPLAGDPELSKKQAEVVDRHREDIRRAIRYYMKWHGENAAKPDDC
ncbi:polymorphic toxin-type HINT domain-containing protein [Actinosynnema sp. CA-248983]